MIFWFTGQPGAGKTTLSRCLAELGLVDFVVDGDELRQMMPLGYDRWGREQNVFRAQSIAHYLSLQGYDVAVALVSPYREQREAFKALFEPNRFMEVYVHTDEDRGRLRWHVAEYEPPMTRYLDLDTGAIDENEAVRLIRRTVPAVPLRPPLAHQPEAGSRGAVPGTGTGAPCG